MSGYNLDHISQIGRPALIECDLAIWPLTSILDLDASKPSILAMLGLCGPFSMVPAVPSGVIKPGWKITHWVQWLSIEMPILINWWSRWVYVWWHWSINADPRRCRQSNVVFRYPLTIQRGPCSDGSCSPPTKQCVCVFTYVWVCLNSWGTSKKSWSDLKFAHENCHQLRGSLIPMAWKKHMRPWPPIRTSCRWCITPAGWAAEQKVLQQAREVISKIQIT